jgi:hypothetical protein
MLQVYGAMAMETSTIRATAAYVFVEGERAPMMRGRIEEGAEQQLAVAVARPTTNPGLLPPLPNPGR